jgi:hypothetical protein
MEADCKGFWHREWLAMYVKNVTESRQLRLKNILDINPLAGVAHSIRSLPRACTNLVNCLPSSGSSIDLNWL